MKPLLGHLRDISQELLFVLGTVVAVDEIMIWFMAQSKDIYRMKNKQIMIKVVITIKYDVCVTFGFVIKPISQKEWMV